MGLGGEGLPLSCEGSASPFSFTLGFTSTKKVRSSGTGGAGQTWAVTSGP